MLSHLFPGWPSTPQTPFTITTTTPTNAGLAGAHPNGKQAPAMSKTEQLYARQQGGAETTSKLVVKDARRGSRAPHPSRTWITVGRQAVMPGWGETAPRTGWAILKRSGPGEYVQIRRPVASPLLPRRTGGFTAKQQ